MGFTTEFSDVHLEFLRRPDVVAVDPSVRIQVKAHLARLIVLILDRLFD